MTVEVGVSYQEPRAAKLDSAILVYKARSSVALATVHKIGFAEKRPVILAGEPISGRAVRSLLKRMSGAKEGPRYLPESVLARAGATTVWYEPPKTRYLTFDSSEADARCGKRCKPVPTPGIVFITGGGYWQVFAFKGRGRPTPETPLYAPPFFNCYLDGRICAGNVTVPRGSDLNLQQWSDAFFRSNFTHPSNDKMTTYRGGLDALWADLLDGKRKSFPAAAMIPARLSLKDLISEL